MGIWTSYLCPLEHDIFDVSPKKEVKNHSRTIDVEVVIHCRQANVDCTDNSPTAQHGTSITRLVNWENPQTTQHPRTWFHSITLWELEKSQNMKHNKNS